MQLTIAPTGYADGCPGGQRGYACYTRLIFSSDRATSYPLFAQFVQGLDERQVIDDPSASIDRGVVYIASDDSRVWQYDALKGLFDYGAAVLPVLDVPVNVTPPFGSTLSGRNVRVDNMEMGLVRENGELRTLIRVHWLPLGASKGGATLVYRQRGEPSAGLADKVISALKTAPSFAD